MIRRINKFGNNPQDHLVSILPSVIAGMISLSITIFATIILYPPENDVQRYGLIAYGIAGTIYLAFYSQ